mmetsp:Transcript_11170/g.30895  ORF Transcript_11170/g.30895 Transcript_11170/m.30895 type:complete len:303 (-) Transcript_11170:113-1021(-)
MHGVPAVAVRDGGVAPELLDLTDGAADALDRETSEDHERGPSVLLGAEIAILLGDGRHEGADICLGTGIPRIQQQILECFGFVGSDLLDHRVAGIVHDLILIRQLAGCLFFENLVFRLESTPEDDGLDQSVLDEIQRCHDCLHGQSHNHAFVQVQSDGHGNPKQRAAYQRSCRGEDVRAVRHLGVLLLGIWIGEWRRSRWDVDHLLVLACLVGCQDVGVDDQQDADRLNDTVRNPEPVHHHGVLPINLPCCQHHRQHHEHLVERHGCSRFTWPLSASSSSSSSRPLVAAANAATAAVSPSSQ